MDDCPRILLSCLTARNSGFDHGGSRGRRSLFYVGWMQGREEFGVDLNRLGVDEAAEMAQEAAVTEASVRLCGGGGDWRGGRTTLLQDLETLVQVILEMGAGFKIAPPILCVRGVTTPLSTGSKSGFGIAKRLKIRPRIWIQVQSHRGTLL